MTQPIERAGTFRGNPTEWAVSTTKNEFPQFVVRFLATEYFDEEQGEWVDWRQYQMEITGFLVLFGGGNKACLAYEQVQKALGWDGDSFAALDSGNYENAIVQFRVEESTYEGVTRLKVTWIDAHDADPGRSIKKLDPKALKDLDAQFKAQLGATPTPKKAAAPATPPKPSAPPKTAAPAEDPTPTAEDADSGAAGPPAKKKPGRPPGSKNKKKADEPAGDGGLPTECSKEEAWDKVNELKTDKATDEAVAEAWVTVSDEIAEEGQSEDDIRPDQWAKVRDGVLDRIPHLPF